MANKRLTVSIALGNTKLGKIPTVSMPPIKACGNCSQCKKACYALKAWRQYKKTRSAWTRNHKLALDHRSDYFGQIAAFIAKKQPKHFKWHASGDILDQDYLDQMIALAIVFPNTRFLCFTKMHHFDFSRIPSNLNVVLSAWPGLQINNPNRLPVSWMRDENNLDSRIPADAIPCPGHCDTCVKCWGLSRGQSVVFNKH